MKNFLSIILVITIILTFTSCKWEQQKTQSSTFVIPQQQKGATEAEDSAQRTESDDTGNDSNSVSQTEETTTITSSISSGSQSSGSGAASSRSPSSQAGSSSEAASSQFTSSQAGSSSGAGNSSQNSTAGGNVIPTFWDYFESYQYHDATSCQNIYYLFHTPARELNRSYPLIIFLHGLGGRVDEGNYGTAEELIYSLTCLENESDKYSAYTLIPSTPLANEGWWTEAQLYAFKNLMYDLINTHKIDPKRIYITGISMGGFTTCELVDDMPPNTFAAAVPLSGASNLRNPEDHFNTAFYIYHAQNDRTVSPVCSRNLYNQLLYAGHPNVNYTEFMGGDHTSPLVSVYNEQRYTFFDWLFAQRLP